MGYPTRFELAWAFTPTGSQPVPKTNYGLRIHGGSYGIQNRPKTLTGFRANHYTNEPKLVRLLELESSLKA
jgi:hypothetical protein